MKARPIKPAIPRKDMKKTLMYLYEMLGGDQNKIFVELYEHNLDASIEVVDKYISEHKLKITDYVCVFDRDFPKRLFNKQNDVCYVLKRYERNKLATRWLQRVRKGNTTRVVKDILGEDAKNITIWEANKRLAKKGYSTI